MKIKMEDKPIEINRETTINGHDIEGLLRMVKKFKYSEELFFELIYVK
jgi:hypothetical protein